MQQDIEPWSAGTAPSGYYLHTLLAVNLEKQELLLKNQIIVLHSHISQTEARKYSK